jgi:hypothetical protein
MKYAVLVLACLLAACAGADHAPIPEGAWHPLNAGQWDIDPGQVVVPELPKITNSEAS